jgi:hypothetical protein
MENEEDKKITYSAKTIRQMTDRASHNLQWKFEVKWGFWDKFWVK